MWLIVRSLRSVNPKRECNLIEGNTIKLGKSVFNISFKMASEEIFFAETPKEKTVESCRFCYSETNLSENPLISICKCSGTTKFVHILCLKEWIKQSLHFTKSANFHSYFWSPLQCELCRSHYPSIS